MSSDPVRTTVDSLLRAVARTDSFAPPRSAGPPRVIGEQFELEVELGRGGMGVVYRAHDRRLDRAVAIKLMHPERWAHVPRAELAAVFEREARATARLNHPAIVTLHQTGEHDGAPYLVLELLDGASLGALVRRPLELDEALAIMIQVADAIAYAHGQGVLHRDLKPHNIFLGDGGRAWVLDFGLAALGEVGAMPSGAPSSRAGTPAYMAPEQRAGEPQDERTDVWALGLLLYQLVTAYEPPPLSTPAALTSDPWLRDLARLPSGVAALVAAAVAWAPAERLPSAAAFAARLRALVATPGAVARSPRHRRWRRGLIVVGAGLALGGAVVVGAVVARPRRGPAVAAVVSPVAFTVALPRGADDPPPDNQVVAVAPDGATVAFLGRPGEGPGATQIYLRRLDAEALTALPGTTDAEGLAFSPDGQWLAYTRDATLWKQSLGGGAPIALAGVSAGTRGLTWLPDGRLVVAPSWFGGLSIVPAEGGAPRPLTTLGPDEKSHRFPHALPDGRTVLFVTGTAALGSFDDAAIEAVDVATGARRRITTGGGPRFVPPATLLVPRAGQLVALPFDPRALAITGPGVVVAEPVLTASTTGAGMFDVAAGTLAHVVGSPEAFVAGLTRFTADGTAAPVPGPAMAVSAVRVSRDGQSALVRIDGANAALWRYDLERGTQTRLTKRWDYDHAVMADDGGAYAVVARGATVKIARLALDGTEAATALYQGPNPANLELSRDGRYLVFDDRDPTTGLADLYVLELPAGGPARRYLANPSEHETAPALSPDGRWLAYVSSDSGQNQVFVQAFPDPGPRVQVSTSGGEWPRWTADGRALVYRVGDRLWRAPIELTGATPVVATPRSWLTLSTPRDAARRTFDLLPDGGVLAVAVPTASAASLRVVRGWRP